MRAWCVLAVVAALGGCKKEEPVVVPEDTAPPFIDVNLKFSARVGVNPIDCRAQYENLGTTLSRVRFRDIRMFVHDVRLIDDMGNEVPVELTQNPFQSDRMTLLDFEDGDTNCSEGTIPTNDMVIGTVPGARYVGLAFNMGVPFDLNHLDITDTTLAPMNEPQMFVNPTTGYYFMRVETSTTGIAPNEGGWPVYINSVGCQTDGVVVTDCLSENIVEHRFPLFDHRNNTVIFDFERLFQLSNLDQNASITTMGGTPIETQPGCQSDPGDPDCSPIFVVYGLSPTIKQDFVHFE